MKYLKHILFLILLGAITTASYAQTFGSISRPKNPAQSKTVVPATVKRKGRPRQVSRIPRCSRCGGIVRAGVCIVCG